jgi:curved DNA-binding protein CbpA
MQAQINARVSMLSAEDSEMNPFTILGVDLNSTKEEVNRAYTAKAHKAHPDHGGIHEDMVKVNAARDAIYMFKGWSR